MHVLALSHSRSDKISQNNFFQTSSIKRLERSVQTCCAIIHVNRLNALTVGVCYAIVLQGSMIDSRDLCSRCYVIRGVTVSKFGNQLTGPH